MLRPILGRAGSGKTYTVLQTLRDAVEQGKAARCIWLVPEQFSFETERMVLRELGPQATFQIKVYSFTRLAEMVAKEQGGVAGRVIDEPTRVLLMSEALTQVSDRLTVYRRQNVSETQVQTMLRFVEECKQGGITPDRLEQAANDTHGVLSRKVQDLSLVLGAYEALATQAYIEPQDALSTLCEQLPQSEMVRGATVFVDGFKGFTAAEMRVLGGLMEVAADVTVTLPTDVLQGADDTTELLYFPTHTAARLLAMAKERQISVAPTVYLRENHRHHTSGLRHLESTVLRGAEAYPLKEPISDVTVTRYDNIYRECEGTARTIRRLMREGMRCGDIAIVARSLEPYDGILDVVLDDAAIPYYRDAREKIQNDTLTVTVLNALRCVLENFRAETVLRLIKTGLLGFSAHSAALLENYVYIWNLQGSAWQRTWTDHPDGFSLKSDEKTEQRLHYLNLLRHRVMQPLLHLKQALDGTVTGETFARAVYEYLMEIRADRMVRFQVCRLEQAGETKAAERADRLWDTMMNVLDTFAAVLGKSKGSAEHFAKLFHQITGVTDLGSIPQQMDAVQIGSADRMRFSAPRVVFVLGANEGEFPAVPTDAGVLSDRERGTLRELELPLAETAEGQIAEERFFVYAALAAPSERLYVSYITGSIGESEEKKKAPSLIVREIRRLLPCHVKGEDVPDDGYDLEYAEEMFARLASDWRAPTTVSATIREVLAQTPAFAERIRHIERMVAPDERKFDTAQAARQLFGDNLTLSASKVNTFYECRFQYFCRYGLRAFEPRQAELDALEIGKLIHYIVQHQVPVYVEMGFDKVTRQQAEKDAAMQIRAYVEETMGGTEQKPSRFLYLLGLLERQAGYLLWHIVRELKQSRFVPTDFELPITFDTQADGVAPVVLTLPDGSHVSMVGTIDRVDVFRDGNTAYIRVVDYKTGSKKKVFRLSDVVQGLNLQMIIYMNTIWQNGGPRYGSVTPAGVLYMPSALPIVEDKKDEDKRREEQMKVLKMDGLLLDSPAVLSAMEEDLQGVFIPAQLNKDGSIRKTSKVATLKQMGALKRRVEKLLCDMAQSLHEGEIAALPVGDMGGESSVCGRCPYRAICGYETGDRVRELLSLDHEEILRDLEENEE